MLCGNGNDVWTFPRGTGLLRGKLMHCEKILVNLFEFD